MQWIKEADPILVEGPVVASYGSECIIHCVLRRSGCTRSGPCTTHIRQVNMACMCSTWTWHGVQVLNMDMACMCMAWHAFLSAVPLAGCSLSMQYHADASLHYCMHTITFRLVIPLMQLLMVPYDVLVCLVRCAGEDPTLGCPVRALAGGDPLNQ